MPRCFHTPNIMWLMVFLHNCFQRRTFADYATKGGNFSKW